MSVTYNKVTSAYELTIGDLYIVFYGNEGALEASGYQLPEVKTLQISMDKTSAKIYASGKVRDTVNEVRGGTIDMDLVAAPAELIKKLYGRVEAGRVLLSKSRPILPEFCMGYWTELSDGTKRYYWHPRCKAALPDDESHETSDDGDPDPTMSVSVDVLPTDEDVWKITYEPDAEHPLTVEQFYQAAPRTIAEAEAIGGNA